jgi:hypothetical protein
VTVPAWHAEASEQHLTGAALVSARGGALVADALDLDHVWDRRLRRVIAEAVAFQPDTPVDVFGCDESMVIGRHIVADGCAITDELLRRVVGIAAAVDESPLRLAETVVKMPCWPSSDAVDRWAADVHRAARLRIALTAVSEAERALLEGSPVANALLPVTRLAS